MTSHPKEPKLPESLEVVAWRYTHKGSGADCASTWRWTSDWPGRDVHDEDQLVRLSDAESALKARDAEIERLRGVLERSQRAHVIAGAERDQSNDDAERYRLLRRGQKWSVIDGIGNTLRADALDAAIDQARATGGEKAK